MKGNSNDNELDSITGSFWDDLLKEPLTTEWDYSNIEADERVWSTVAMHEKLTNASGDEEEGKDAIVMVSTSPSSAQELPSSYKTLEASTYPEPQIEERSLPFEADDERKVLVAHLRAVGLEDFESPVYKREILRDNAFGSTSTAASEKVDRGEKIFFFRGTAIVDSPWPKSTLNHYDIFNKVPSGVDFYDFKVSTYEEDILTVENAFDELKSLPANKRDDFSFWKSTFNQERLSMNNGIENGKLDERVFTSLLSNSSNDSDTKYSTLMNDSDDRDITQSPSESKFQPATPTGEDAPNLTNLFVKAIPSNLIKQCPITPENKTPRLNRFPKYSPKVKGIPPPKRYLSTPATSQTPLLIQVSRAEDDLADFIDTRDRAHIRTHHPSKNMLMLASGEHGFHTENDWKFIQRVARMVYETGNPRHEVEAVLRERDDVQGKASRDEEYEKAFGKVLSEEFGEVRKYPFVEGE